MICTESGWLSFTARRYVLLPVGLDVVGSTEQLDLPGARRESLYHAVDLVWFVTGGADLGESEFSYSRL